MKITNETEYKEALKSSELLLSFEERGVINDDELTELDELIKEIEKFENYSGWTSLDVYLGLDKDSLKKAIELVTN